MPWMQLPWMHEPGVARDRQRLPHLRGGGWTEAILLLHPGTWIPQPRSRCGAPGRGGHERNGRSKRRWVATPARQSEIGRPRTRICGPVAQLSGRRPPGLQRKRRHVAAGASETWRTCREALRRGMLQQPPQRPIAGIAGRSPACQERLPPQS